MKLASISVIAFSLVLSAVVGCSSGSGRPHSTDTGVHGGMDAGPGHDSGPSMTHDTGGSVTPDTGGTPVRDTGGSTGHDTGSGTSCTVACTSDSQCASACGAVPGGGTRCCDTGTMRCFVSHSTCPAPGRDGGSGGMSY
jgi:hypothetical protein